MSIPPPRHSAFETAVTHSSPVAQRHFRRNWLAFYGDHVFFSLGLVFASTSTVLPAFAATLTQNKILVGAVTAVWAGGWLLPQMFAAPFISQRRRKYPAMIIGQAIGRPVILLFAVWVLAGGTRFPGLTLFLLLATLAWFVVTDAVVALAWFDLLGKSMAPHTRGRLMGIGQLTSGVLAIGAGALIQYLLGPRGPGYPVNFGLIFALAALVFGLSFAACAFNVEPPEPVSEISPTLRGYLPQLARLWRADRAFGHVTIVRLLTGAGTLATAFYVVYATDIMQLPAASVGLFAGAATVGGALSGAGLGLVADRAGSHRVIQISASLQFLVPLLALVCHLRLFGAATPLVYPLLYVLLGAVEASVMLGFFNFVLEIAPPGQRPIYIGLTNTLSGLLVVMPLAGGWVLQATSYPVLFTLTASVTLIGALVALRLPNPRHKSALGPSGEPASGPLITSAVD
jgi:MFS family permease